MEFNEVENLSDTQIMELYREVVDGPSNLLAYYSLFYFCDYHYGTIWANVNENSVAYSYNTGTPCSAGVK